MKLIRPIVITETMLTACNVPETDYPAWSLITAYTATTSYVTFNHKNYQCLVSHTNAQPDLNIAAPTPKWLDLGYDNRWKMFDKTVGSQTIQANSITVSLTPGTNFDSLAILDAEATSITVAIPSTGFTDTFDMIAKTHINNAYQYFFEPITLNDTLLLCGMTPTSGVVNVTINYASGTAKVGTLVLGLQIELGATQFNPGIGITDYSTKTVDPFGNYTVLERVYAKRMSCELMIDNTAIDNLHRTLAAHRATPVVWVGDNEGVYSCMVIYGFYKSFQITIPYPSNSMCTLEIEGLS